MTKEEFCKRLKDINLTQKEFSEITNVPYSTLNNWGFHDIQVPKWVGPFIEHYEKSKKYDSIRNSTFAPKTKQFSSHIS